MHNTAYDWVIDRLNEGYQVICLADEVGPSGAPPFFCMPVFNEDGTVRREAAHLVNPHPYLRTCAVMGLIVGAHRAWHRQFGAG